MTMAWLGGKASNQAKRMAMAIALCAGLAPAALSQAPAPVKPSAPGQTLIKDWIVTCDNSAACTAQGTKAGDDWDGNMGAFLEIAISGSKTALPVARFGVATDENGKAASKTYTLQADGRPLPGLGGTVFALDDKTGTLAINTPAQVRALMAAGKSATSFTALGRNGDKTSVSANGMLAALRWIDAAQGRAGTQQALVATGSASMSANAPASPSSLVVASDGGTNVDTKGPLPAGHLASLAAVFKKSQCDRDWTPDDREMWEIVGFATGDRIYQLPCYAGAYNFAGLFVRTSGTEKATKSEPVRFTYPVPGFGLEMQGVLVNAGYDPATRTLSAFNKGRGIGDCGTSETWVLTAKGFELQSLENMPECRGIGPDHWPVLYRRVIAQ